MTHRFGATPAEWQAAKRLAKEDLLPVVSNPHLPISERSRMKSVGKTPSQVIEYGGKRVVVGKADWTSIEANVKMIEAWAEEPDHGICIQTRRIRALDVDVPDKALARRIVARWLELLGLDDVPVRFRAGTGKRLLAFIVEGEQSKRSFPVKEWQEWDDAKGKNVTKRWLVEFLADGQQFVAVGTHPDGTRYEWQDGFPKSVPVVSAEDFEAAWEQLAEEFALEGHERVSRAGRAPTLADDLEVDDPVAEFLINSEWPTYDEDRGKLFVDCPWKDNHSSDNGETETAWLLAGTGKYRNGHFACRHAGCSDKTDQDFFTAVGYRPIDPAEFDDLTQEDEGDALVAAYMASAPGASPKTKELKSQSLAAARKLPLPGFNRDPQGRIETSLENLTRALTSPRAVDCWLAYDEFRAELMFAEAPGEWQSLDDGYLTELVIRLERLGLKEQVGSEKLTRALNWVIRNQRFDSAKEWLMNVVPEWDGVSRIRHFWPRYMKTKDTPYTRALGDYTWTAQADRILNPGCQVDMVPVMVSPEGHRKTSVIAAIAPGREFFGEFSFADDDKDLARKMRGKLVGELAELRGVSVRDGEGVKSWVTRREEEWTPKFKEFNVILQRRLLFYGTTNDYEFMKPHMGKRRWLPVEVRNRIDLKAIERDRMQLWAEARDVFLYGGDGQLWEAAETLALDEYEEFREVHKWEHQLNAWLDDANGELDGVETPREIGVRANEALEQCIGIPASRIRKSDQMDIGDALKACGMVREKRWVEGKTVWLWVDARGGQEGGQEVARKVDRRTREGRR